MVSCRSTHDTQNTKQQRKQANTQTQHNTHTSILTRIKSHRQRDEDLLSALLLVSLILNKIANTSRVSLVNGMLALFLLTNCTKLRHANWLAEHLSINTHGILKCKKEIVLCKQIDNKSLTKRRMKRKRSNETRNSGTHISFLSFVVRLAVWPIKNNKGQFVHSNDGGGDRWLYVRA